jgi:ubiquinone/menaquinone biosynthesis C-methylase UbiE
MSSVQAAPAVSATPDIATLKSKLKTTWMAGDYDRFSRFLEPHAVEFFASLAVPAGTSFLDVGCGSGQLGLIAARHGARVWGCDIASNWIEVARSRADVAGLEATFDEGDAEDLPYESARFDLVASIYGAMFAPRPDRVAAEMLRVTKPGGRVAMANWTKEGFIGQMFGKFAKFIAPPGMPAPALWGHEDTVRERLGAGTSTLTLRRQHFRFDFPFGPQGAVDYFRQFYGPTVKAFEQLGADDRQALEAELVDHWTSHNRSTRTDRTVVDAEYLHVVGVRR